MYTYTWYQWLGCFYIYCFAGWIFESTYVSIRTGRFVNRGFLRLPMLPLYGTGAVMMLWVSLPVQDHLILVYLSGVLAATALEYVTGWAMERLFKVKYWDYSNQKYNLNGYICLTSSIAWGFLTILLTEVLHPPVERLLFRLPVPLAVGGVCFITVIFLYDTVQSVRDALALGRALEAMTRLKAELDDVQVQLALLKAETVQRMADYREETADRMMQLRDETAERVAQLRDETAERMEQLRDGTAERMAQMKDETVVRMAQLHDETAGRVAQLRDGTAERMAQMKDETVVRMAQLHDETAGRMAQLRDGTAERMEQLRDGTAERMELLRDGTAERMEQWKADAARLMERWRTDSAVTRAELNERLPKLPGLRLETLTTLLDRGKELSEKRRAFTGQLNRHRRNLLLRNPSAASRRFSEALKELRELAEEQWKEQNRKDG
ncbi:hypothetical protein B5E84_02245 [Lachnoclostridium sp. An14]|uniref:putative ABC transporter permease n=1 Tax=Lachnoclostridium sp. An14 TaxID=1965562 RepID=UPI000B38478B|nr:hypothetical protein [Lachnoclostridium sp. An14]OUQ21567.1 hypothetical protein B5E84_02245 [Lachnoclostridium sp. An14]